MKFSRLLFLISFYVLGLNVACAMESQDQAISFETRFNNLSRQFTIAHNRSSRLLEEKRSEITALKKRDSKQKQELKNLKIGNGRLVDENLGLREMVGYWKSKDEQNQNKVAELETAQERLLLELGVAHTLHGITSQELSTEKMNHRNTLQRYNQLQFKNKKIRELCAEQGRNIQASLRLFPTFHPGADVSIIKSKK